MDHDFQILNANCTTDDIRRRVGGKISDLLRITKKRLRHSICRDKTEFLQGIGIDVVDACVVEMHRGAWKRVHVLLKFGG